VGALNNITSTLMIRLDPADSLMNILGMASKLSTETAYIQNLVKDNPQAQAKINKVFADYFGAGKTEVGGVNLNLTSVAKAMAKAPKELLSEAGQARLDRWQKSGLAVEDIKLMSDMFQEARIKKHSFVNSKNKSKYKEGLLRAIKKSIHIASKPHRATNNYTQYVALAFGEDLAKAAGLNGAEQYQFMLKLSRSVSAISTHVTKPRLFQGAMGMAVSLYQSYAFHTAAQLLKYGADSATKPLVTYAALNTTFFGAQSVPAFKFINAQIGQDPETGHADLYTAAYSALPKEAADFIMYGAGGALLQSNLSVRGNMTPRNITVIPTSFTDIPGITALSNLVGAVYDNTNKLIRGEQNIGQAVLNTTIDSHLNRPLAGLAQVVLGKSVDSRHSTISIHEETMSLASGLRVLGLKPLKETIVTDYYWRNYAYQTEDRARRNNLAEIVRLRYERDPEFFNDPQRANELLDQYVKSGGKQAGFERWYENSVTKGNTDLKTRLEEQLTSYLPYAQNFNALNKSSALY